MLLVKLFGKLPLEIKEYLILNHILPWLTACMNGIILEKGYNPDNIKVVDKNLDNLFNESKINNFDKFTPKWVAESFKNVSKHPIYTDKINVFAHTPARTYECTCEIPCDCDVVTENTEVAKESNDSKDISNYSSKVLSLLSKLIDKE